MDYNRICRKCGGKFHYCTSCGYEHYYNLGFCPRDCWIESDDYKFEKQNFVIFYNSLSLNQKAYIDYWISDMIYEYEEELPTWSKNCH